ncbi:PP0621 family protein [Thiohalorhabdus sp.]|uniref:PP0621 family protein n=1 Tax=Thiohalorhabdus sp. TaxID=3094134 RepID=UPI002FC29F90
MILRLIALAILIFFAYRLIRRAADRLLPQAPPDPKAPESQPIVPCKACGTFVPRDEAIIDDDGDQFCSEQCRDRLRQ